MFDYIIVGSGFAGAVLAERIVSVLNRKVLVIEKRAHIGGNCYDFRDETGIIVHKYGPHLFHTDHKEVWTYLSNYTSWRTYKHRVLAEVDGKKIPVPFNLNSLYIAFPLPQARRLEEKLIATYGDGSKIPILELKETDDKDLQTLAQYIYDKIFVNYTAKQWGLKPEEIDSEVTARVPVVVGREDCYFTDTYQGVPEGGYTKIFKEMLRHPNIKLALNTDFRKVVNIDIDSRKIYFMKQEFKGKLIFTGMIDDLFEYKYGFLPYRSLDLRFETIGQKYFQEVATVNYPNEHHFTRITEFKHIHPIDTDSTIILKEYPRICNRHDIPFYPVFKEESKKMYNKYKEFAEKFHSLILIGRLAEYRYYDMDDIVKRALEVFEEKIR